MAINSRRSYHGKHGCILILQILIENANNWMYDSDIYRIIREEYGDDTYNFSTVKNYLRSIVRSDNFKIETECWGRSFRIKI